MDAAEVLRVTWGGDDGDGIGRLTVDVSSNGFAGRSSAWFTREAVEEFARSLAAYPLDSDGSTTLSGGFVGDDPQTHVELHAYPVGSHGQVVIGVSLSTPRESGDRPEGQHHVHLELPTTYERLREFSRDLERITSRNGREALVEAERLML